MGQGKKNQPKCGNNKLWLTTTATFRSKEESFPCKSRGGLKDIDLGIDFSPNFTYKTLEVQKMWVEWDLMAYHITLCQLIDTVTAASLKA